MSEQNASATSQEIPMSDVLFILGQKEVELQYERAKVLKASHLIAELQAELAKLKATRKGKEGQ